MSDSKNGPVTTVSNKAAEDAAKAKQTRVRDLDFNRWEKEFLNLAFPVKNAEGVTYAFDIYPHVPTHAMEVEEQLLATFDEKAKAEWATIPDLFKKMALEAFSAKLPKAEFPTIGKLEDLPTASMRLMPHGSWELISRDPDMGVPDHLAILAVKFADQIRPRLQKHRRGADVLGIMIEAFGFFMAEVETIEVTDKDGNTSVVETGNWTSRSRKPNEDLAADLHAAVLPGK